MQHSTPCDTATTQRLLINRFHIEIVIAQVHPTGSRAVPSAWERLTFDCFKLQRIRGAAFEGNMQPLRRQHAGTALKYNISEIAEHNARSSMSLPVKREILPEENIAVEIHRERVT